jgi:hypothetical protein
LRGAIDYQQGGDCQTAGKCSPIQTHARLHQSGIVGQYGNFRFKSSDTMKSKITNLPSEIP